MRITPASLGVHWELLARVPGQVPETRDKVAGVALTVETAGTGINPLLAVQLMTACRTLQNLVQAAADPIPETAGTAGVPCSSP